MTDAERARLDEIEQGWRGMLSSSSLGAEHEFVASLARRAEAAESTLQIFLTDRGADDNGARDSLLIAEAAKAAARECAEMARDFDPIEDWTCSQIADAIRQRFTLDSHSGPTLSQRVAQECCEIVDGLDSRGYCAGPQVLAAIRRRFGLGA